MSEELYYIQNGYVGNAILWWRKNSQGYTTDINEAEKYTKEFVQEIINRPQTSHRAWPCEYIDSNENAKKLIIDSQYLESKFCLYKI